MAKIKCIKARQIFDSRGNPTVEVRFAILIRIGFFDASYVSACPIARPASAQASLRPRAVALDPAAGSSGRRSAVGDGSGR
ncbi:hypothetical protein NL676_009264 [Syzygium grande]|nr:hypothetical protein NL676_009264 [Syzygium grande]